MPPAADMGPMTDLGLSYDAKTDAQTDAAELDAGSGGHGDLAASPDGVALGGGGHSGADLATEHAHLGAGGGGGGGVSASADGVDAGGALGTDVATDHLDGAADVAAGATESGLSLDAALDGALDVMGHLVAQFSTSLTALLGF